MICTRKKPPAKARRRTSTVTGYRPDQKKKNPKTNGPKARGTRPKDQTKARRPNKGNTALTQKPKKNPQKKQKQPLEKKAQNNPKTESPLHDPPAALTTTNRKEAHKRLKRTRCQPARRRTAKTGAQTTKPQHPANRPKPKEKMPSRKRTSLQDA